MTKTAFLAAAFTVLAGTASATTMQAVYTGTVTSSHDYTDSFGSGNVTGLDGLDYSLVFLYDTPAGAESSGWDYTQQVGGSDYGWPDPVISATLTINGMSLSSSGDSQSYEIRRDNGSTTRVQDFAFEQFVHGMTSRYAYLFDQIYGVPGSVPLDLSQPFSQTSTDCSFCGYFYFIDYDGGTGLHSKAH